MLKSIIFVVKSFLGNFYRHLAVFSGHTDHKKARIEDSSSQNGPFPASRKLQLSRRYFIGKFQDGTILGS